MDGFGRAHQIRFHQTAVGLGTSKARAAPGWKRVNGIFVGCKEKWPGGQTAQAIDAGPNRLEAFAPSRGHGCGFIFFANCVRFSSCFRRVGEGGGESGKQPSGPVVHQLSRPVQNRRSRASACRRKCRVREMTRRRMNTELVSTGNGNRCDADVAPGPAGDRCIFPRRR